MLRAENESLKSENYRLQADLRSVICPNCGGPAMLGGISFEDIRIENARLREEVRYDVTSSLVNLKDATYIKVT